MKVMKVLYLTIVCTYRCNMACPYCRHAGTLYGEGYGGIEEDLSKEEITRIAKIGYKKGIRHFRLTGGEPLTRNDLHDLILSLKKIGKGIDITLNTNGRDLEKHENFFSSLDDFGLRVSIDSYFKSPGSPKNWTEKVGATIKRISKKIPV